MNYELVHNVVVLFFKDRNANYTKWSRNLETLCDALFPRGPVDHRQLAENLCVSYHETHT